MTADEKLISANASVLSKDAMATQCAKFAESISSCEQRWAYCFARATFWYQSKHGLTSRVIDQRSVPTVERITGCRGAAFRLAKIGSIGMEEALHYRFRVSERMLLTVGVMEPWHIGHVYLARLADYPHVMKIGFSRRVRQRLEDVESKAKLRLLVPRLIVGTMLDEQWQHRQYQDFRISGEWFFDPASSERSLPPFLAVNTKRAA